MDLTGCYASLVSIKVRTNVFDTAEYRTDILKVQSLP